MEISFSLIRELGYNKIERYYRSKVSLDFIRQNSIYPSRTKLSAYTVANEWDETFGLYDLEIMNKFVDWYELYYPTIGKEKNVTSQNRVAKAYMKMRTDYIEACGQDIGDLGIYAPKLELYYILRNEVPYDEEILFLEYMNCIYAWCIKCYSLLQNKDRDSFERVLLLLSYDTEEFLQKIRSCANVK